MIPRTPKKVIVDASCLIVLDRIGELELLRQLYGTVLVTREIAAEFGADRLPEWVSITPLTDINCQRALKGHVDSGEASIIALALGTDSALLVIDELRGRRLALQLGLPITGTLGILLQGKFRGLVPSVRSLVARMQEAGFHLRGELIEEMLRLAGE